VSDQDTMKDAVKEALKEWLDDKFSTFGKWAAVTLAALGLAAFVYFVLWAHGWKAPQ
jgi:tryptophan synthase beta subunit